MININPDTIKIIGVSFYCKKLSNVLLELSRHLKRIREIKYKLNL